MSAASKKVIPIRRRLATEDKEPFNVARVLGRVELKQPDGTPRRPAIGQAAIFKVYYEVGYRNEFDAHDWGDASEHETALAFDGVEAIQKVRSSIEARCARQHAEWLEFLKENPDADKDDREDNAPNALVHFRAYRVEVIGDIGVI